MSKPVKISVVSPVYGSPETIPVLCGRLHKSLRSLTEDYEIILVFDCSPDNGWERICEEGQKDARVKGINLSRNFGQHYAIIAGLTYVSGEWVVVMDCDLQDPPEEIPDLYKKAREGFSVVFAQRVEREDSWLKRTQSAMFHAVFDYLTDRKSDPSVANFGIYHQKVIQAVLVFGDSIKCFPLIVSYVGFKTAYLPIAQASRASGESSYTLGKAIRLAVDLMLAYSNKPLRMFTSGGFVVVAISLLVSMYYLVLHLLGKIMVSGYASLILSVWFIGGMLMLQIGVIGVYLGRVFNQTKNRPSFVVDETINTREKSGE